MTTELPRRRENDGDTGAVYPTACLTEIAAFADVAASSTSNLTRQDVIDLVLMEHYNGQACAQAFALAVALAP